MSQTYRRRFLLAAGALLVWRPSYAQRVAKVPRVGFITGAEGPTLGTAAFERSLQQRGHVLGKTVQIEWRYAAGHAERFPELVRELVSLPVDVLLASGPQATVLASRATKTIPIVMAATSDPVKLGVVESLSHPGGNVTGITADVTPEFFGKQVQVLKETLPRLGRLAMLMNPAMQGLQPWIDAIERSCAQLKIQLIKLEVQTEADLKDAFALAARQRAEALLALPDPAIFGFRHKLGEAALKAQLPSMHFLVEFVVAGGMMMYGPTLIEQFERAAGYVDKILKGARPQDLPVEQPTKFETVLNLRTVKALGVTIPQSVLLRADRVID